MGTEAFEKKTPLDEGLKDFLISRTELDKKTRRIASFCVIQVHFTEDRAHEIIKFDSAHGECHVHKYCRDLNHKGEKLPEKGINPESFKEFRKEIERNWKKYLKWYKEKWLK